MSEKNLKLKLQIAGRIYPMTIEANQEESLRLGVIRIQTLLKKFEDGYSIKDKQDLLAMCAIQLASGLVKLEADMIECEQHLVSELQSANKTLEAVLSDG